MIVKICCIASVAEARLAVAHGAAVLGLVSAMPSGPGVISDEAVSEIAAATPPPTETFLLTSSTTAEAISSQHRAAGTTALQLVDAVAPAELLALRRLCPGVKLVQVIHVLGEPSIAEAVAVAPLVDAILLDSGNPTLAVKELGGTGRVHDWATSRRIRDALVALPRPVPLFLAGGLRADNVAEAIRTVRPNGIDLCSGVRRDGVLDAQRLAGFMAAVHHAVGHG